MNLYVNVYAKNIYTSVCCGGPAHSVLIVRPQVLVRYRSPQQIVIYTILLHIYYAWYNTEILQLHANQAAIANLLRK